MGLEPMISRTTIWRANQLHHTHHITYRTVFCPTKYHHIKFSGLNEPGGIRTLDLRLRRPLLYPTELPDQKLERAMGIEPTTSAWKAEVLPLNYTRNLLSNALCIWSERQDSNLRPPAPKAGALPS